MTECPVCRKGPDQCDCSGPVIINGVDVVEVNRQEGGARMLQRLLHTLCPDCLRPIEVCRHTRPSAPIAVDPTIGASALMTGIEA